MLLLHLQAQSGWPGADGDDYTRSHGPLNSRLPHGAT